MTVVSAKDMYEIWKSGPSNTSLFLYLCHREAPHFWASNLEWTLSEPWSVPPRTVRAHLIHTGGTGAAPCTMLWHGVCAVYRCTAKNEAETHHTSWCRVALRNILQLLRLQGFLPIMFCICIPTSPALTSGHKFKECPSYLKSSITIICDIYTEF